MENTKPKVILAYFTAGAISGHGAFTRVEAVCRAVKSTLGDSIDFQLAGVADKTIIPDHLPLVKELSKDLVIQVDAEYSPEAYKRWCSQVIMKLVKNKPDLLLIDAYPGSVAALINRHNGKYSPYRPSNVWVIAKNTPGGYAGMSYQSIDRVYQTEPNEPDFWDEQITREKCRSIAEKETGILGYQDPHIVGHYIDGDEEAAAKWNALQEEFNTLQTEFAQLKDTEKHEQNLVEWRQKVGAFTKEILIKKPHLKDSNFSWPEWYRRNGKPGRKLLAPIDNVQLDKVLNRKAARKALLEWGGYQAPFDDSKPLILASGTQGGVSDSDRARYNDWLKESFSEWGLNQDNAYLVRSSMHTNILPELWRYLAGVDYFLTHSGYGAYYEARKLSRLGIFTGQAKFLDVLDWHPDSKWRAKWQDRLWNDPAIPDIDTGEYIAVAIKQKFRL